MNQDTSTPPGVTDPANAMRDAVGAETIDTAPRDGTPILLFFGNDTPTAGWWVGGDDYPWAFIDTGLVGIGTGLNHARDGLYGPSHWMPFSSLKSGLAATARIADLEANLAQAAEDERDRLYHKADREFIQNGHPTAMWASDWLKTEGGKHPADRAKARAASASAKPAVSPKDNRHD